MGDIRATTTPVRFAFPEAERLSAAMRSVAGQLERQATERRGWATAALQEWRGRYADQFRSDAGLAEGNAREFATTLRQAAAKLDHLAQQAREEQTRRNRAAAWQAEQDSESGAEKFVEWLFGTDEAPPYMAPSPDPAPIVASAPAVRRRG